MPHRRGAALTGGSLCCFWRIEIDYHLLAA
ncbi:hypothetical protein 20Sep418_00013 [Pseudomonas phage 20Sep418]|uniref:Uncharacterized protein n=7 Tax=Pakpunavirus TaxID=1921407 RepID=A0A9E6Q6W1_9CAUD|nr:hypothetical protein QE325_gp076 [Pseudomonas phage pPA-3099-2aT.2]YP_010763329.1 hypothetical protein QE329_gp173 [Pseudomonas phage PhL_UNISO_PA-DSM_ph0034]YP_010763656.1 hypothetical protein QE331_gp180 [Pseudomonas phage 20Sep416]YP_010765122.1 hypothetical protein QE347_gp014 [Pseudomonas phage vB_Paer_Ps12]YP_010765310.1 hypothetical protein QE348_gp014 [Pseudomonas phage vB_Paer_PsIn]YP_010765507.1 hypothetical protein QE349_gp014 [Pseudomonas phage vB_Paer_PsCh]UOL47658.1 hypotheti